MTDTKGAAGEPLMYPPQQQTTVVTVVPQRVHHKDYLLFSIFNLLCCCCCIGVVALIKSMKTRKANDRGDPAAERLSREALRLNKIALGVGIAFNLIWIGTIIALVVTGVIIRNKNNNDY